MFKCPQINYVKATYLHFSETIINSYQYKQVMSYSSYLFGGTLGIVSFIGQCRNYNQTKRNPNTRPNNESSQETMVIQRPAQHCSSNTADCVDFFPQTKEFPLDSLPAKHHRFFSALWMENVYPDVSWSYCTSLIVKLKHERFCKVSNLLV